MANELPLSNTPKTLSVVVPVYNEERTLEAILAAVLAAPTKGLGLEVVCVNDSSTDRSGEILNSLTDPRLVVVHLQKNLGKSGAVVEGLRRARGDYALIQDADLEYDPGEYERLLGPLLDGRADVVYGSRYLPGEVRHVHKFWHSRMNRLFTGFTNVLTNRHFTDVQTCYKAFTRPVVDEVGTKLTSKRFGFDPEFTAKISRRPYRIVEVPVSYRPRTQAEGKHMRAKDALRCYAAALRYNVFDRS